MIAHLKTDEFFYLDVITRPVGSNSGEGVVTLTGMRTILDDDGNFNTS